MKMNKPALSPLLAVVFFLATLTSACSKAVQVKAIKAQKIRVESTVSTTSSGTVEADQQAILGFSATGRVSRVRVRAGDRVRKGQLLAELENMELQTISRDALTELSRTKELFAAGLVSKAALDESDKASQVARANLDRAVIRAPFDGLVTEVNLELGELPGTPSQTVKAPIRIVDLGERIIRGSVDEVDLGRIKVGNAARIRIPAVRAEPFDAEVSRVVPFVSTIKEQDRTSQVEFKLSEKQGHVDPLSLPVGASADVEIVVDFKDQQIAIPTRAILGATGKRFVFILQEGHAVKKEIKTGIHNYERTAVTEGLNEGDQIILPPDDAELKDGMKVKAEAQPWP